ncbi:WD40 repeat domain-containing protein [Pontibacter sp. G13]|uniref:WD40 repeat domain-containing protein n=1 Tax=Pontibacter sp. G13 TaxID=3074898 RepID=UPI0028891F60|nr:WD40 repeat domain-containing protein [Pontibacter sp. G13]WNJ20674.1 WD40 repeat domain-containing protein [Pontibacter sp. G13]
MTKSPRPSVDIQIMQEYAGHTGSVFAMQRDASETYFYTSGDDGVVARWSLTPGNSDGTGMVKLGQAVYSLCVIPDQPLLVLGSSDGTVHFVDTESRKILHTYRKSPDAIFRLTYDPDTQTLWVLHGKGGLSVLDLKDFSSKAFVRLSEEHLRAQVLNPNGDQWLIGASDGFIYQIDREAGGITHKWKAHDNSVFSLAVHGSNKYLLSGSRDAHLKIWDLQDGHQLIKSLPAHNFTINDIAISPDGDHFVTASRDKTWKVWDAYRFQLLKVVDLARNQGHKHSVNAIMWLNSDNSVISCSDDRRVIRWHVGIEESSSL